MASCSILFFVVDISGDDHDDEDGLQKQVYYLESFTDQPTNKTNISLVASNG